VEELGKPFNKNLAKIATEKTKELVEVLNRHLKRFRAELGPGRDSDIIIICKSNPNIKVFVEVEVVRADRWEKIISQYSTVRWPLAKKTKCKEYSSEGKLLILLSVNQEDVTKMFYIDCESWVDMGHEEKAPFVRAGRKSYRYRKGQEEPFWAIEKDKVEWGIEGFEEFLANLLIKKKKLLCK
jgi:hypothetical protein